MNQKSPSPEKRTGNVGGSDQWIQQALNGLRDDLNKRMDSVDGRLDKIDGHLGKIDRIIWFTAGGIALAVGLMTFVGWLLKPFISAIAQTIVGSG